MSNSRPQAININLSLVGNSLYNVVAQELEEDVTKYNLMFGAKEVNWDTIFLKSTYLTKHYAITSMQKAARVKKTRTESGKPVKFSKWQQLLTMEIIKYSERVLNLPRSILFYF